MPLKGDKVPLIKGDKDSSMDSPLSKVYLLLSREIKFFIIFGDVGMSTECSTTGSTVSSAISLVVPSEASI